MNLQDVRPTETVTIVSRTHLIAVIVISKLFDVFQPLTRFIVTVGLSHSTARSRIKGRVSYKERTGCSIRQPLVSNRLNAAATDESAKAGVVPTTISYHYTIVSAHSDARAVVVVGGVVRNH